MVQYPESTVTLDRLHRHMFFDDVASEDLIKSESGSGISILA